MASVIVNKENEDYIFEDDIDKAVYFGLQGRTEEAQQVLKNYPNQNHPAVLFNLGWYDIYNGHLAEGMKKLDAGRFVDAFGSPPLPGILWKDEPLENRTVLFNCEGGLGDQIVYVRFAKDFQDRGANVVVACNYPVARLFNRNGFTTVSNDPNTIKGVYYDYWVPSMSVAHMLGYEHENLCGDPYLTAEPKKLPSIPNTLKVGLRWSGNPGFDHESFRKFPREKMHDLLSIEGATFYSLQKDTDLVDDLPLIDFRDQMTDFYETASIIKDLDLVITSCTSVAHCAAALGVETWVVVPILPYYMWALKGSKSPWYESVTLYRQTKLGCWDDPFNEIKKDFIERVSLNIKENAA